MGAACGPDIVNDGVVLHLDAGSRKSYPGSGTAWNDLSGNGNNSTLTGSPTYSSNRLGSFTFNGTSHYASFFAHNLTTTATIEMWCSVTGTPSQAMYMGFNLYDVYFYSPWGVGFNTGNADLYGITPAMVTALGLSDNWRHYVFEMRSDVSYTNNKIYVNGALQPLVQQGGTELSSARNFNSGNGRIGYWAYSGGGSYYMPMNLGLFKIYNRALTAAEVSQNFNATRGRFGI